jgi:hypothetical protein
MKTAHYGALASAILLLVTVSCQSLDEYTEVNCEYFQIGSVCDCRHSPEVSLFLLFIFLISSERSNRELL